MRDSRSRAFALALSVTMLLTLTPAHADTTSTPSRPDEDALRALEGPTRIVGGTTAPTGAYPWYTRLDIGPGKYLCGGTLISSEWVLTAAHCVYNLPNLTTGTLAPSQLDLYIGQSNRTDPSQGEMHHAAQIVVHPSYPSDDKYDVAVVKLDSPSTRRWARLAASGDPIAPGQTARAVGFGRTCETCSTSSTLMQVDLPIQSDATMQNAYGSSFDPPTMVGAGPLSGGMDTCNGDSGGPLFVSGALQPPLVGATSWGNGCAKAGYPGVYAEDWDGPLRSFVDANVPRPANDNFASAQGLSGPSGSVSGSNTNATGEVGEPPSAGSEADTTVWYSWTAPQSGTVTMSLSAGFDTTLSVYTGTSVGGLTAVASNDNDGTSLQSKVVFSASGGTTYRIQVDGYAAAWGPFTLAWGFGAAASRHRDTGVAVFRPSTGVWYAQSPASAVTFGQNGDIPVPGDYDGDGRTDIAVFRPSTGVWYIGGTSPASIPFGASGDIPVPGDYNGDGRTDIAVYRPSTGVWYVQSPASAVAFGASGDIPLPLPNAVRRFFFNP